MEVTRCRRLSRKFPSPKINCRNTHTHTWGISLTNSSNEQRRGRDYREGMEAPYYSLERECLCLERSHTTRTKMRRRSYNNKRKKKKKKKEGAWARGSWESMADTSRNGGRERSINILTHIEKCRRHNRITLRNGNTGCKEIPELYTCRVISN